MDGAILVVRRPMSDAADPGSTFCWGLARKQGWVPYIVVALEKCDAVDDAELLDLVELKCASC